LLNKTKAGSKQKANGTGSTVLIYYTASENIKYQILYNLKKLEPEPIGPTHIFGTLHRDNPNFKF